MKRHAAKLASHGFRVLVPDIYKGKIGIDKEEASHLMSNLDWAVAIGEIGEAAKYLKDTERCAKVGITGFCMGGALSLCGAATSEHISCAAPFYGIPDPKRVDVGVITSKAVQGHFGAEDAYAGFSDPASARALEEKLKAAGNTDVEVFVYDGVGHGFLNDTPEPYDSFEARREAQGFAPYDAAQAELAWSRLVAFFKKQLA